MAKVGVILSKQEQAGVGVSSSGALNVMLPTAGREKVDYDKWGTGNVGQMAQLGGKLGRFGRLGAAALGGFNRFYDATASGRPGAFGAAAGGAYTGYAGSQGLENWAAERGAAFGDWQNRRNEKAAVKEQEGMADYEQGAAAPHSSKGGEGMARDYAFGPYSPVAEPTFDPSMFSSENMQPADTSPQYPPALQRRIDTTKNSPEAVAVRDQRAADRVASANQTLGGGPNFGTLGNLGGSGSPNIFSPSYTNTQRYAGIMENLRTPVADPTVGTAMPQDLSESLQTAGFTGENKPPAETTQMDLSQYTSGSKVGVKNTDTAKLIEHLNATSSDGTDEKGNIVRGKSEVQ